MKHILKELNLDLIQKKYFFNNIYSITLEASNVGFFSNGKGLDLENALNGAYGEMCERLLTRNYFEDYFLAKVYPDSKVVDNFLTPKLKQFYQIENLEKEDLIDFSSCTEEILSIPFIHKKQNKKVYFPINLIQNLYASNGMAFYSDKQTAFNNALSEIIERYVKFEVIKNGLSLPKINHKYNSKNIQVYNATLNKYPVMAVSYIKGNKILLSFGCDINQEKAINKAYFELMQGRENFENIGEFSNNIYEVKDSYNLESHFISNIGLIHTNFLKENSTIPKKWEFTKYDIDKDIYFRQYQYKNFYAYHIIVPNFSEIYPIDDLIYNNKNQGKFYRDLVLKYKEIDKKIIIEELEQLNPYLDLGKFIGVIFDKEISVIDFIDMIKKDNIDLKFDYSYIQLQQILTKLNLNY